MKLFVDITGKQFLVTLDPGPKKDAKGNQRTERDTGRPMWTTQVCAMDASGGETITITTVGTKPEVLCGQYIVPVQLEAMPWNTDGRHGVAFRAIELQVVSVKAAK